MVGGIVDFGGDLAGTNCFTSKPVGRALKGMTGVHVKEGGPGGGPGGCLKGGVAIGGERLGGGGGFVDFRLLGDGVGVGGGAPWGFGLGPHGGGNGEGDGGGGGFTLADCCRGCVCNFACIEKQSTTVRSRAIVPPTDGGQRKAVNRSSVPTANSPPAEHGALRKRSTAVSASRSVGSSARTTSSAPTR